MENRGTLVRMTQKNGLNDLICTKGEDFGQNYGLKTHRGAFQSHDTHKISKLLFFKSALGHIASFECTKNGANLSPGRQNDGSIYWEPDSDVKYR